MNVSVQLNYNDSHDLYDTFLRPLMSHGRIQLFLISSLLGSSWYLFIYFILFLLHNTLVSYCLLSYTQGYASVNFSPERLAAITSA